MTGLQITGRPLANATKYYLWTTRNLKLVAHLATRIHMLMNTCILASGVSIIADVAESIAETQPISINRIEIWDRLIGKIQ